MKNLLAVALLALVVSPLHAQRKNVYVHGYTRHNGTHVTPHYRSSPGFRSFRPRSSSRPRTYSVPKPRVHSYTPHSNSRTRRDSLRSNPSLRRSPAHHPGTSGVHRYSHRYLCPTCSRDSRGRFVRNGAARRFMRRSGYPHGRPGYVVDHIVPLACGGRDDPSNMQWQTIAQARAKDRYERRGCR